MSLWQFTAGVAALNKSRSVSANGGRQKPVAPDRAAFLAAAARCAE